MRKWFLIQLLRSRRQRHVVQDGNGSRDGVISLALLVATASRGDHNKDQMVKAAQYCMPDDDEAGEKNDLYGLM